MFDVHQGKTGKMGLAKELEEASLVSGMSWIRTLKRIIYYSTKSVHIKEVSNDCRSFGKIFSMVPTSRLDTLRMANGKDKSGKKANRHLSNSIPDILQEPLCWNFFAYTLFTS